VKDFLTRFVMLDSFIVAHVKFVKMLIELKKVLSRELKCFCRKTSTFILE